MQQCHAIVGENTRYQMEAIAILCGDDISVSVCGGCAYHVGAVALGEAIPPKNGKERSACVSTFCVKEHRDDDIARIFAKRLATQFKCCVSVAAGIHVDDASLDDIHHLIEQGGKLCDKLCDAISQERPVQH